MKIHALTLLTVAALAAAPAMARGAKDSADTRAAEAAKPVSPLAAEAMATYTECVVQANPGAAERLLAKDFRTEEYREDVRRMAKGYGRCVPGQKLEFSSVLFAGNLAEHLLERNFSTAALADDLGRDRSAAPIQARTGSEAISMCIAMRSPQATAALFHTEAMSGEENKALAAIAPQLQGCVPQGTEFRTNRSGLRALLALAAYRIAVTGREGEAG